MKMKFYVALLLGVMLLTSCGKEQINEDRITIAVSIVPEATFVKAVAGDLVDVMTLIPPGASPTNYQPTPKEMADFAKASVYFSIGVGAEEANILPNIVGQNKSLIIVPLAETVDQVYPPRFFGSHDEEEHALEGDEHDHTGRDPHTWMSPKHVSVMVEQIRDTLINLDSNNEKIYRDNAEDYLKKLSRLDVDLIEAFDGLTSGRFIVMHPSLGYFADAYGLEMIAVEEEGKEASVTHLQTVIDYAVENDIHMVFYQQEFDSSQAKTIAKEIDGEVVAFEPLSANYIESMYKLRDTLMNAFEAE